MKRIIASADGHRTSVPNAWTDVDVRTPATIKHERDDAAEDAAMGRRHRIVWRHIVRNRIAFRHDDKRGPISATLNHAVY